MKRKNTYILICLICITLGTIIVMAFNNHGFIRGVIGDVLVVILMYYVLKIFVPIKPLNLLIIVLIFSYLVETTQYFHLIEVVKLEDNFMANIIMGSTFDYRDLLAYTLGGIIAHAIDIKILYKEI